MFFVLFVVVACFFVFTMLSPCYPVTQKVLYPPRLLLAAGTMISILAKVSGAIPAPQDVSSECQAQEDHPTGSQMQRKLLESGVGCLDLGFGFVPNLLCDLE